MKFHHTWDTSPNTPRLGLRALYYADCSQPRFLLNCAYYASYSATYPTGMAGFEPAATSPKSQVRSRIAPHSTPASLENYPSRTGCPYMRRSIYSEMLLAILDYRNHQSRFISARKFFPFFRCEFPKRHLVDFTALVVL